MVAAVGVNVSQGRVSALPSESASTAIRTSQARMYAAASYPSEEVRTSQAVVRYTGPMEMDVRVSQARVYAAGVGRVFDPKVRAFTFTLDGHDFYVLRLGVFETLIYDVHSDQFYIWGSGSESLWKAYDGIHWPGGSYLANSYGSNVVVGDDANGSLYFLDPDADQDDDPVYSDRKNDFIREVSGQYPIRGYSYTRCYGVELYGSIGDAGDGPSDMTITLSYSDDAGNTYLSREPITIAAEDFNGRVMWRSLGSMKAPGRIFKITDYGQLKRIDGLNMVAEGEGRT